jgi:hypothetical protein
MTDDEVREFEANTAAGSPTEQLARALLRLRENFATSTHQLYGAEAELAKAQARIEKLEAGIAATRALGMSMVERAALSNVRAAAAEARMAVLEAALRKVDEIACRSAGGDLDGNPPEPVNPDGEELANVARDALDGRGAP